jgi:hypothetical protein
VIECTLQIRDSGINLIAVAVYLRPAERFLTAASSCGTVLIDSLPSERHRPVIGARSPALMELKPVASNERCLRRAVLRVDGRASGEASQSQCRAHSHSRLHKKPIRRCERERNAAACRLFYQARLADVPPRWK